MNSLWSALVVFSAFPMFSQHSTTPAAPAVAAAKSAPPAAGASVAAAPAAAGVAPAPAMETKPFHSDLLHLTYNYPAAFVDVTSMAAAQIEQAKTAAAAAGVDAGPAACVTVPFAVAGATAQAIVVFRADAGCMKTEFTEAILPGFAEGMVAGAVKSAPTAKFGAPQPYMLGSRAGTLLTGSVSAQGMTMNVEFACVLVKPDIVCWQFLGPGADAVTPLTGLTVKFDDGGAALPVVPVGKR